MQNKIVVRYADGRVLKGSTADFAQARPVFHVVPTPQTGTSISVLEVSVADLKALFFVKDHTGDPAYDESKTFEGPVVHGRKIRVEFNDGEVLAGTTTGYQPDRPGFFLVPVDPKSNNDHCFVVASAVKGVTFV